tara:strand:- start:23 stop:160 length:138 start_codon:yes stop_codon:yes gene_type:complete
MTKQEMDMEDIVMRNVVFEDVSDEVLLIEDLFDEEDDFVEMDDGA